MVAEKSQVCFCSGVKPRMKSSSSLKPMFSISSASSSTTYALALDRLAVHKVDEAAWRGDDHMASSSALICVTMLAPP